MASNLTVIAFDNIDEAGKVHDALVASKNQGFLSIDDSAVIVKDEHGKIHVQNQLDRGVKVGAVGGSLLGLLLAGIFFPFAGLIIGGLAGAGIGALMDMGISKKFVKEVAASMEDSSSALFIITRNADPDMVMATLRPYKGTVLQTSLDEEAADSLRDVLSKRIV
ncbi:MAG: DUF1269 domain-containing protein [Caldilineaceae bacterium]|jgi:uncharacterized membrane protein